MRERTRVGLCRAAFIAVAIVPCLGILAFAAWRNASDDDEDLRRVIRENLGCIAEWESLEHSAPHVLRLRGLRLHEPRGGALLAEFDQLSLYDEGHRYRLEPGVIRVPSTALPAIRNRLRHLDRTAEILAVTVDACEIRVEEADRSPHPPLRLQSLEVQDADGERRYTLRLGSPGVTGDKSCEITVTSGATGNYQVTLQTHRTPARVAPWSRLWPELAVLGPNATFQGQMSLKVERSNYSGKLSGTLADLDLGTLFGRTKQNLSGAGAFEIQQATLHEGKLVAAQGTFSAADGEIGVALLYDLCVYLGLNYAKDVDISDRHAKIRYSSMGTRFKVTPSELRLEAVTDPAQPIIRDLDGKGILFSAKSPRPFRPWVLARLLYPTSDPLVAASNESWWLADALPLPDAKQLKPFEPRPAAGNPVRQAHLSNP